MSIPNFEQLISYNDPYNLEFQNLNSYSSLEDSYSVIFQNEMQIKNSIDFSDMHSLNNSNNKNIEGDKECSPAPAPLRSDSNSNSNQNQNELSNSSHNMECPPEVLNKALNTNELEEKTIEMLKIFNYNECINNNEEDLIEKPFDKNLYFIGENINIDSSNNNIDLENKSAAVNVIPLNDNLNSPPNKLNGGINNLNNSQSLSASNSQELSCPKNFITPISSINSSNHNKNNISKSCQNIEKIFFININEGRKNKNKTSYLRKLKPDSLRKKIKARFHKKLRQIINIKLKQIGSKFLFDLLPQPFITNINIEFNRPLLNITMRELFQKTFGFKAKDREKINYNIKVIKYLDENPDMYKNEEISNFLDSTYEEIIQKYMHGKYLMEDIERLKKEGENSEYINRYSFIAMHWIDFYKKGCI